MTKWIVGALVLLTFALSPNASASAGLAEAYGPSRAFGPAEESVFAEAEAFWGRPPTLCTSLTKVVVAVGALGSSEGRSVAARATRPTSAPIPCGLWVEEDVLAGSLCSILRHEFGHLLGFGHEDPDLAGMPSCDSSADAYDSDYVAERQAWREWDEWRSGCYRGTSRKQRQRCFKNTRRTAEQLRKRFPRG